jgi:hypothetical protein
MGRAEVPGLAEEVPEPDPEDRVPRAVPDHLAVLDDGSGHITHGDQHGGERLPEVLDGVIIRVFLLTDRVPVGLNGFVPALEAGIGGAELGRNPGKRRVETPGREQRIDGSRGLVRGPIERSEPEESRGVVGIRAGDELVLLDGGPRLPERHEDPRQGAAHRQVRRIEPEGGLVQGDGIVPATELDECRAELDVRIGRLRLERARSLEGGEGLV